MTKNLDELKAKLYTAFDKAVDKAEYPSYITSYPEVAKAAAESLQAAADLAKSIVSVEREIAEREEKKSGMKLPGKG